MPAHQAEYLGEDNVSRGIEGLPHLNDQDRIDTFHMLLSEARPRTISELDERTRRRLEGLPLVNTVNRLRNEQKDDDDSRARIRTEAMPSLR